MTLAELTRDARRRAASLDPVMLTFVASLALLAAVEPAQLAESIGFTFRSILDILPFLAASVAFAAGAKATGLDAQIASVFAGRHALAAIAAAAAFGVLSPFCSCGVVPLIAGLLAAGVPLAPVMAFWLASPLMDPEMFLLMLPVFGLGFTATKLVSAFFIGMLGGLAAHALARQGLLDGVLKGIAAPACGSGCGGGAKLPEVPVVWDFWHQRARRRGFVEAVGESGLFLGKWLALAFFLESLMVAYVPAEAIGAALGSGRIWAVPLAVLAGVPAYLNGYAAIPTVSGLIELGTAPQAGLGFMLAGGVTSLPAAVAVWPLVRGRVFALYIGAGVVGALLAALAAGVVLSPGT